MSDELKIVISLKGTAGSVGVQAPGCDPIFFPVAGDLPVILGPLHIFVDEARRQWETRKLYPKCESPLPSQSQPAARPVTQPSTARPAPAGPPLQPALDV
jgi:hypothetical protein